MKSLKYHTFVIVVVASLIWLSANGHSQSLIISNYFVFRLDLSWNGSTPIDNHDQSMWNWRNLRDFIQIAAINNAMQFHSNVFFFISLFLLWKFHKIDRRREISINNTHAHTNQLQQKIERNDKKKKMWQNLKGIYFTL